MSASSVFGTLVPAHAINGDRKGLNSAWWADNTSNVYPDWIEVNFGGSKTINEIDVFGLQQNPSSPVEPTPSMTSSYALTNFEVQYWTGSAWATVPGGSVTGNDKVWRKFSFPALTTIKIRVHVTNVAGDNRSQVVEIEAHHRNVNWLVADDLGTPRMIFDQTGSLAATKRHDYLPFGEELFAGVGGRTTALGYTTDTIRQKFTLKERDIETGLDYFEARYFSNLQGRFTSVDPENYQAMRDPGEPQSWNGYAYVNNNPLGRVDPDGKGFWEKLKNAFFYGHFVENDELAKLEQDRRDWLSQHYYERDAEGNWRPFDASTLSTQDVFDKYREVKFFYDTKQLHPLTNEEILEAWNKVPIAGAGTRGPSGRVSTQKYLENNWEKSNFGNVRKSIDYHLKQHVTKFGKKMSDVEYTQQALRAFADKTAKQSSAVDRLGRPAVKVVSKKEGSGLFTPQGKIIWFQPKF